jgi:3-hydroxybutyryl-CoA dehydrogenase
MAIRKVGVVGLGLMGSGIAQVCAQAGLATVAREVDQGLVDKGLGRIKKFLDDGVAKGKVEAGVRDTTLANLTGTTKVEDLADCDLVIEAIVENLDAKHALFAALDKVAKPETIYASNTSSLSVTEMAAGTRRPGRVVGLHFFNPVPLMPLVEVVRGLTTSAETFDAAVAFVRRLGKEPIVARDRSGFIVNRLLVPFLLDAVRALEEGTGSVPDIDRGMQLGCGHPMGPFTLLDLVGLDTVLSIGEILFQEYREARFAPPGLLRRMVAAGFHGRKSGRGFYDYSFDPPRPSDVTL